MSSSKSLDWADDEDYGTGLPSIQTFDNPDGTKTMIEFRIDDNGKKVKVTRVIRKTVITERVQHAVAERKKWKKFGKEAGKNSGVDARTTSVGENVQLRLQLGWTTTKEEEQDEAALAAAKVKAKGSSVVRCRACKGNHFTAQCPYKSIIGPVDEPPLDASPVSSRASGALGEKGRYIAPHLRAGSGRESGDSMFKRERDDSATLRVTNLSDDTREEELRDLFRRFGGIQRVYLAKDKETGRAKGFAFVSYYDRDCAIKARDRLDGYGWNNLILRCEFSKPRD
ncbi:translation initiation factor eIF3g [Schizosaccharomyces pombe]|uniref:Eukaryotic translation initiation factor 3 subunit G n=1 Tax=Schizosaccharomyces pombe (strain 972 / ATCC 24843) TaxID=284812 RepID=EIF3G_SCHPO|nr:translation initiation factor eIF3g [Schizosaccharomyces pombe]P78795.2 RecName: Full=Eukaryotic translation initiation factor 3 subunit G; Short=eIF3g; AltName: Full=Eukaryotic translation initiation factor 3 RNA-binding subunit; Short=eIF-3 RNA-binding subunit; AltName: Full=Translation initiation factor eIF3 p33 subunit homolog; Short=eIF3 p33 homolog [Schizosaccharomyces pombe 972h-]CAA18400.1 translation initiation factor eIF3g [Schizosaccharomyces pombe]|eukprot:NP_595727.1 translation initiation factor eIF3g [Schizosaccharomyces pombe]